MCMYMYYVYVYVCQYASQYASMTSTLKFGFAIFDCDTVGNAITRILGRQSTHSPVILPLTSEGNLFWNPTCKT